MLIDFDRVGCACPSLDCLLASAQSLEVAGTSYLLQSLLNWSLTYLSAGAGPCSVVGGLGGARDSRGGCHETKACISKTISFFSLES